MALAGEERAVVVPRYALGFAAGFAASAVVFQSRLGLGSDGLALLWFDFEKLWKWRRLGLSLSLPNKGKTAKQTGYRCSTAPVPVTHAFSAIPSVGHRGGGYRHQPGGLGVGGAGQNSSLQDAVCPPEEGGGGQRGAPFSTHPSTHPGRCGEGVGGGRAA